MKQMAKHHRMNVLGQNVTKVCSDLSEELVCKSCTGWTPPNSPWLLGSGRENAANNLQHSEIWVLFGLVSTLLFRAVCNLGDTVQIYDIYTVIFKRWLQPLTANRSTRADFCFLKVLSSITLIHCMHWTGWNIIEWFKAWFLAKK